MNTIEAVRAFWNRRPCNLRHSPSPIGTRAYFDEVEKRKYLVEPHIPLFAEFEKWNGKRVLEIGCGIGTDTINFARAGAQVTAVDVSSESLALAMVRAEAYGLTERIRFHCGDAEELSSFVPCGSYDLVYAFGSIHHTPNPERVIAVIRNYMFPHGEFRLMLYHCFSWKVGAILWRNGFRFWRLAELIAQHSEAENGCPVTYAYSRRGARRLLEKFQIQECRVEHIFPYRIAAYREYRYEKEWYFRCMPHPLFRLLEQTLGWHLLIRAALL